MRFVCWQIFVCRIHSSLAFLCFFLSCCWCENSFSMFFLLHNVVFFPHNSRASFLPPTTVDDVVSYATQTTSTQRVYWKACKLYSTLKLPAISEVLIKVNLILISCLLYDFVCVSEIINSNYGFLPGGGAATESLKGKFCRLVEWILWGNFPSSSHRLHPEAPRAASKFTQWNFSSNFLIMKWMCSFGLLCVESVVLWLF